MTYRIPFVALVLLAGAPAALAAPDLADPAGPQTVVRVDDLDLDRERGVKILYQRLRVAAVAVCPAGGKPGARAIRARECQADVLDRTVAEAALPQLTALHRARAGNGQSRVALR